MIYEEEVTRPADQLPKFISEFVMAQLENPGNLARLRNPSVRHLVIVLMETGMRGGDASVLAFNPIVNDSTGWQCLRFDNSKVGVEQLIPLSAKAADAIRAQQDHVRATWANGSPWLFPGITDNDDCAQPYAHGSLSNQLRNWQREIDVRDEAGQPVRVHAHQFRHTVGTRLINAGVPQHVIQKLLGHASPRMTARYAQIHDSTVRDAFERYCHNRINTAGETVPYDPDASTADAEWVKHNLSRISDSLPNGYCGRPPQQNCPHPNACLTCPDFQTTPEFLDVHRRDAATRRSVAMIAELDRAGTAITVAGVATAARVSRSWLYEQPVLLADITRLRDRPTTSAPVPGAQRASDESLRQRLDAARAEIGRLRTENTILRDQVARALGDQRIRR